MRVIPRQKETTMTRLRKSIQTLSSIAAVGGMIAAAPAPAMAQAGNPCAPKSGSMANPCAPKDKKANPCAPKSGIAHPCAPKK